MKRARKQFKELSLHTSSDVARIKLGIVNTLKNDPMSIQNIEITSWNSMYGIRSDIHFSFIFMGRNMNINIALYEKEIKRKVITSSRSIFFYISVFHMHNTEYIVSLLEESLAGWSRGFQSEEWVWDHRYDLYACANDAGLYIRNFTKASDKEDKDGVDFWVTVFSESRYQKIGIDLKSSSFFLPDTTIPGVVYVGLDKREIFFRDLVKKIKIKTTSKK